MMFDDAFISLMNLEGWDTITNDPKDSGGLTKYGISQKAFPNVDIRNLSLGQAKQIYLFEYWLKGAHLIRDPGLAFKFFCTSVVMGNNRAGKFLQEACNALGASLVVDGKVGNITAQWINRFRHPAAIEAAFEVFAGQFVIALNQPRFLAGWLMRIDKDMV
jgi:lysozyme family protein